MRALWRRLNPLGYHGAEIDLLTALFLFFCPGTGDEQLADIDASAFTQDTILDGKAELKFLERGLDGALKSLAAGGFLPAAHLFSVCSAGFHRNRHIGCASI